MSDPARSHVSRRRRRLAPMPKPLGYLYTERSILLWIARLPLLRTEDLVRLTGETDAEVGRALGVLRRHGWTDRVHRGLSSTEPEMHVLRDVAASRFAAVFQLDEATARLHWPIERRDILDRITAIDISDGLNDFLAGLAEAWRADGGEVADLRVLPRSRRDPNRWWPSWTDAYGCLQDGERYGHFFVAWDTDGAPEAHRRARARAWFDAMAARNVWGEGQLPPILLLCPSVRRRSEWATIIERLSDRRDVWPPTIAVRYPDTAPGQWFRLDDDRPLTLRQVLDRDRQGLPFTPPQIPRYDLLERGVDTPGPTLEEWARGLLGGEGHGRADLAALSLRLTPAHQGVLNLVARHPYLNEVQIAALLGNDVDAVRRILRELQGEGLISSVGVSGADA